MTPPILECPTCGANWTLVKEMLAGMLNPDNKAVAEYMLRNCTECKANFVQVER